MGTNGKNRSYCELGKQLYVDAVERSEFTARRHGHVLGVWQQVDEHLHASLCRACGAMVRVARPAHQERWRTGGRALEQTCLLEVAL
jgi:hypothetical protein